MGFCETKDFLCVVGEVARDFTRCFNLFAVSDDKIFDAISKNLNYYNKRFCLSKIQREFFITDFGIRRQSVRLSAEQSIGPKGS